MTFQLRDYQVKAFEAARTHDGFGLFMQQRTGKTVTAICLARDWECTKTLVICPKKAIPVWKQEIQLVGVDPSYFEVVSFESFRIHQLRYLKEFWDLVIVDESHRIKERSSQVTKAVWKVGRKSRKRLILSGSPQGNGMEDYYAQLRFIRPDLFPTWGRFSDDYLIIEDMTIPGREDPFPKITGYINQKHFQEILAKISYRVTRDEVAKVKTLVRVKKHLISPTEAILRPYRELEKELITEIRESLITAPMALVKALKLHQLCGGYVKDDDGNIIHVHHDKLNFLWGMIDGELKGESVVIVSNYKAEMDEIARGLKERGLAYTQIRGKHQYDPKDRSQVTLLNPSAGEAINLAHHNHMIIFSMNYSYLKWEQFKDRIVLVDTPEVKYYYLMMKGTIDELVYDTVTKKKKLSDTVMSIYKR